MERRFGVFEVFGRVDLTELYEEWRNEPVSEDPGEDPRDDWQLKHAYAFQNHIFALLFEHVECDENWDELPDAYYRVVFYTWKNEKFQMTKKVRFQEHDSYRVDAISVDRELNTMLVRRSKEDEKPDIHYNQIGDKEITINSNQELLDTIVPQSEDCYTMMDGNTVLFFWLPSDSRLETDWDDPHDFLYELPLRRPGDGQKTDKAEKKPAMEELQALVGLKEMKETVSRIVAFAKLQKLAEARGNKLEGVNLNLAFLGNPGTAKTTAARIFARIMKENGIISKGELIEVGRAELVAKYVGQTAIKVKEVFEKAKGNVLFIDEAYSLLDNWENEFGDEAIATIVQEMENNRDDMIVIFAGYPDKMEQFLSRNPGLRSRVPYVVPFADYSVEELTEIALSEAARRGFSVGRKAKTRIREICAAAQHGAEFGNGRFSRNLVEAAIMKASERMVRLMPTEGEAEVQLQLEAGDFVMPENLKNKECTVRRIGFEVA